MKKLDDFFQVRKNIIFERACFNRRDQQDGESADEHISVLHSLAEDCEYGTLKAELIRDRLVVGIRDTALSQKLQLDPLLTLEKAQKCVRQNEAVKSQQTALQETPVQEPTQVDQMRQGGTQQTSTTSPLTHVRCQYCGRDAHRTDRSMPCKKRNMLQVPEEGTFC